MISHNSGKYSDIKLYYIYYMIELMDCINNKKKIFIKKHN